MDSGRDHPFSGSGSAPGGMVELVGSAGAGAGAVPGSPAGVGVGVGAVLWYLVEYLVSTVEPSI